MLTEAERTYQREYARTEKRKAVRRKYNQSERGKAKNNENCRRWRAANPDKLSKAFRKHDLKRHYDMTLEQWETLFKSQGNCCACCGSTDCGRKTGHWCTDHSHKTGKVRGILCQHCNAMLGHAKDDPSRLRMGAKYLEEQGDPREQYQT